MSVDDGVTPTISGLCGFPSSSLNLCRWHTCEFYSLLFVWYIERVIDLRADDAFYDSDFILLF